MIGRSGSFFAPASVQKSMKKVIFIQDYAQYKKGDIISLETESALDFLLEKNVIKIFKSPKNKMMHAKNSKIKSCFSVIE